MSIELRRAVSVALRAALVAGAAASALPQAARADAEQIKLEEVTVTATRRAGETDVQTTAIAVSAVSSADLDRMFISNLSQMAGTVPNFSPAKITGFNAAGFAIRGTSLTDIIVYYEPPVGVVIDDFVLLSAQTQLLEPFDIETMEILRGPQGTLFGKNTTGGVVNVRTKSPQLGETSGEFRARLASYGRQEYRGAVNIPMGEQFALRVSGTYQESDGYYKNGKCYDLFNLGNVVCGDGSSIGGDDIFYGRAKLLWQPNDDLKLLLQYERLDDTSDTPPSVNESPPGLVFDILGFPGITGGDPLDQAGVTNRDDGLKMADGHKVKVDGLYLNVDWSLDSFDVAGIVGYREQESRLPSTYTGEVFASLFDATRDDDRETTQVELRLASKLDGPFNYTVGAFWQEDDTSFNVFQYVGIFNLFGLGFPPDFDDFDSLDDCLDAPLQGQSCFNNDNAKLISNRQELSAYAVYVDGTYEFTDKWALSGGVRWTSEEKKFFSRPGTPIAWFQEVDPTAEYYFDGNDLGRFPCSDKIRCDSITEKWEEPTYRATLSYTASEDLFTYFTYARGFKSGGFNDQTGSAGRLPLAGYDPEFADSFEAGIKTDLLDNRLRMNLTAFYVTYEDQQRSTVVPVPPADQETRTFNASDVTAQGLELELTAALARGLTAKAAIGYLDAEYDKFEIDLDGNGTIDQDLSGRTPTRSPEWTAGFDLTYVRPVGAGIVTLNGNVNYEDESIYYYSNVTEDFDTTLQAKTLLGLSATFADADDRWFVSVYGRNLSDERYRTASQAVGALWTFATYGEPRTYGVEVGFKFAK
jgi:iron complex outermembrane receptor protein